MTLPTPAPSTSATAPSGEFILILACPDRPGIVHAVSGFLVRHGGNIRESQQFGDQLVGRFFMRIDFAVDGSAATWTPMRCGPTSTPSPSSSAWSSSCGTRGRRTAR